jgi:Domain of unknown function (DUF4276)
MKQVFIICEGFTEKAFVTEILAREILGKPLHAVFPGKAFNRAQGGDIRYARVRPDIIATIKSHEDNYCTTFIDYYALGSDFPRVPAGTPPKTPGEKAALIERAVEADIATELGNSYNPTRFKAYLSMHEFEGLLFSDPAKMASAFYVPALESDLRRIRSDFATPEHINDDPQTAPSKRIVSLLPEYDKVTAGNLAALSVGIEAIKRECRHFKQWFDWLSRA